MEEIELLKQINNKLSYNKDFLTLQEACSYLGMSKSKIYKLTSNRVIPHYKVENKLMFNKKELNDWIKDYKVMAEKTIEEIAMEKLG